MYTSGKYSKNARREFRQPRPPVLSVRGGILRSLANNVAVIRAVGFTTSIRLVQLSPPARQISLTILVENVRGREVLLTPQDGALSNILRSTNSVIFDVVDPRVRNITITYSYLTDTFDFFVVGDMHGVFTHLRQMIRAANDQNPLFIMVNGDMTHSGHLEDYHAFMDIVNASPVPVFTSLGNHDKRVLGSRRTYRAMLAPLYYSFGVRNAHFIVLDSSRKRGIPRVQYRWLERELYLARHKRIFVFLHRPPVCPKYSYLCFSATTNANRFLRLMQDYEVELVIGSHIHALAEFEEGDVRYVVTGGGGGALWQPANKHHYLHVFVRKDTVRFNVVPLPTPEAKLSQRLKDGIRFNVEFHLTRNKVLKQAASWGTTLWSNQAASTRSSHNQQGHLLTKNR